jgi:hypothetical protein
MGRLEARSNRKVRIAYSRTWNPLTKSHHHSLQNRVNPASLTAMGLCCETDRIKARGLITVDDIALIIAIHAIGGSQRRIL